jgi:glycosyltransferase involved in cell wall biosynthesis
MMEPGSKVLILGTIRDCASTIEPIRRILSEAFDDAESIQWFVVESDSGDTTVETLEAIARQDPQFRFVSLGQLCAQVPQRTARIAQCRNRYLEEIRTNPEYQEIDYVVVADLDEVNLGLTRAAVRTCWHHTGWDMMWANQRGPYYDIWAL